MGVGTELMLGQIANTNAQTISQGLAAAGVDVLHHSAVGDNHARMVEVLSRALERVEVVVVTGGLGPTPDDITREAVAAATGRELERHESLALTIRTIFERLGRDLPPENLKQADLPRGATAIAPVGTAPGFWLEHDGRLIFALPGVPWEMDAMLEGSVLPVLRRRSGAVIVSREIVVMGLGESHTHERIADIVEAQGNPTIAYLAGAGQVRLRITAKGPTEAAALELIGPVESDLRARLGDHAVPGHASDVSAAVSSILKARGLTVAVAESLTGGLLAAALTAHPGASEFFLGGVTAYATDAKRSVLRVDPAILAEHGAVSAATAEALAEGVADLFVADLGISTTGVAGPDEMEGRPVGTVFLGASLRGRTEVREIRAYGNRANIVATSVNSSLDLARRLIAASDG